MSHQAIYDAVHGSSAPHADDGPGPGRSVVVDQSGVGESDTATSAAKTTLRVTDYQLDRTSKLMINITAEQSSQGPAVSTIFARNPKVVRDASFPASAELMQ
ncbi:hypothetical protein [Nocardia sp. NPDC058480]|uniref:hypothetical protein n=1 Tax=unclassified Nocardia TaxID=2637762 RepID=UPI003657429A